MEQNDPLVSICVMAYNRPDGIDRVLRNLTSQTYKKLQIIVSDDFSPDENVSKVILGYAKKDSRIKAYTQKVNLRYFKNLKFLLEKADGDFIMWCDDDDKYDVTYVEKCLYALLNDKSALTSFSYYTEINEDGVVNLKYPKQEKLLNRLTYRNTWLRILYYLFTYNGYGYCNIYYGLHRKSILSWFIPEKFGMGIDSEFGMKLISLSHIALVKEHLYYKTVDNEKQYLNIKIDMEQVLNVKSSLLKISLIIKGCCDIVQNYLKVLPVKYAIFIILFSPIWILSIIIFAAFKFIKKIL